MIQKFKLSKKSKGVMVSDFSPVAMFSGYNINVSSDYFATFLCTIRVDWR